MNRIMIRHNPVRPAMSPASPAFSDLCTHPSPDQAAALDRQCFANPWDSRAYGELLANPCVEAWISLVKWGKAAKRGKAEGGEPAGLLCFLVAGDEMELYRIGVQPKFRGLGLALDLLHRLVGESQRRHTAGIHLEVRKGNQPARNLYARGGFEECGRRARYYSNPMEDAVLYRLQLPREEAPIPGPDSG
jgi:ribosomal-protein-alanine N-acetyltransferase